MPALVGRPGGVRELGGAAAPGRPVLAFLIRRTVMSGMRSSRPSPETAGAGHPAPIRMNPSMLADEYLYSVGRRDCKGQIDVAQTGRMAETTTVPGAVEARRLRQRPVKVGHLCPCATCCCP